MDNYNTKWERRDKKRQSKKNKWITHKVLWVDRWVNSLEKKMIKDKINISINTKFYKKKKRDC